MSNVDASSSGVMRSLSSNFLGSAPVWYKFTTLLFLVINPLIFFSASIFGGSAEAVYWAHFTAGWALIIEFIFTLAMALKCYPLQPGGLITIEALFIGMTSTSEVYKEILNNVDVLLLLMFMVAAIYFVRSLLLFSFSKILCSVRNKIVLSLIFCGGAAFLSAFLDALTVLAVIISIAMGFYTIYNKVVSSSSAAPESEAAKQQRTDLHKFRAFLRSLMMHAAIGTALGGICTLVGEPQNLIIGKHAGWEFGEFFFRMLPVSLPVLVFGLITCVLVEHFKIFGYGEKLPESVFKILKDYNDQTNAQMTTKDKAKLIIMSIACVWLVLALALHLAVPGMIGLSVIILVSSFCGVTSEGEIGKAFTENMPFVCVICVFFAIIAVISSNDLFGPVAELIFSMSDETRQLSVLFFANGLLSAVSDNVFVGTLFMTQCLNAYATNVITLDQFEHMAIAVNAGTNIPSIMTPNGQSAFLFLLTSALAPLIRLSYLRMMKMALPYAFVLAIASYISTVYIMPRFDVDLVKWGLVTDHEVPGIEQQRAEIKARQEAESKLGVSDDAAAPAADAAKKDAPAADAGK
jgi:NhaB family Na+:H+ antiporter